MKLSCTLEFVGTKGKAYLRPEIGLLVKIRMCTYIATRLLAHAARVRKEHYSLSHVLIDLMCNLLTMMMMMHADQPYHLQLM
jgi:hypothetical protein